MTISKPIEDLLIQANSLLSSKGVSDTDLKILHGTLTRLRNKFYEQLDNEDIYWDDPKQGDTGLQNVKRTIEDVLDALTSRLMSSAQQEFVRTSLADVDSGEPEDAAAPNKRRSTTTAELIVQLGWDLLEMGRKAQNEELNDECEHCLLSWDANQVVSVAASVRQIRSRMPIRFAKGGIKTAPTDLTVFWVGLWGFFTLSHAEDEGLSLTTEACQTLMPSLMPDTILNWSNQLTSENSSLTAGTTDFLKSLAPRRIKHLPKPWGYGGWTDFGASQIDPTPYVYEEPMRFLPWMLLPE